jgi:tRNA-dihydrouridine synthase B
LRGGLRPGDGLGLDLAPRLEAVGVAALGVHPRAGSEYYHGTADHSVTAAIKAAVTIPVMASGDVDSVRAAHDIFEVTGSDAVMVGRGVTGNPWLVQALLSGEEMARPALPVVVADLRALLALVVEERGQERAARWIRKLLACYLRPSRVAAPIIEPIRALATASEVDAALAALVPEEASRTITYGPEPC